MIIECVSKEISDQGIPKQAYELVRSIFGTSKCAAGITIGKQYIVYAVAPSVHGSLYYIGDDDFSDVRNYPFRYPSVFFRVVDSTISRYWKAKVEIDTPIQTFAEWSSSSDFYERLINGESYETEVFSSYRKLMDFEFPWPAVKESAVFLESSWVQCPYCGEAWSVESLQGMLQCSKCQRIMRNPTYRGPTIPA